MKNTKQVIVWRNDLKVRKGKISAQCAHASMAFLTKGMRASYSDDYSTTLSVFETKHYTPEQSEEITHWLENSFRKICVYVNSEEELRELHQKALDKGLMSHIVEDNAAIIEVFEEFIAMMKAPSEKIKTDDEI